MDETVKNLRANAVIRIDGSIVPIAFKLFLGLMEQISAVKNKGTVSVFLDESESPFASVMKQGSNNERINLVLNKSREWKPSRKYKRITLEPWHTGDLRATVPANYKAMKQAFKLCHEWKDAKEFHKPTTTVLGTRKGIRRRPRPPE